MYNVSLFSNRLWNLSLPPSLSFLLPPPTSSPVCKLPDSMHSWFLVAHLHMWLVMVRLRREGEDGQFLTKQLVEMFWEDVKQRPRALGVNFNSHL